MSKFDGVFIFLLGIPVTLMAWITLSEEEGYYMSEAVNQGFPMGIMFVVLIGAKWNIIYYIYNLNSPMSDTFTRILKWKVMLQKIQ